METRRPLRAVLLDIDDTLVDTRAAFGAAVRHVLAQWLPHLDPDGAAAAFAHWVGDPRGYFRAYTRGEHDFVTQRRLRADDLHAVFGGPELDDAAFAEWQRGYEQAFRAAWRLAGDALGLLDALDAGGMVVGAVTNGSRAYQETKLAALGLARRLPILVALDDLGRGKPDPDVFALACDRACQAPADCAYVGDELDVDARGARDAGLFGIWLDRHGTGATPGDVPVARRLDDVPGLLAGIDLGREQAGR